MMLSGDPRAAIRQETGRAPAAYAENAAERLSLRKTPASMRKK